MRHTRAGCELGANPIRSIDGVTPHLVDDQHLADVSTLEKGGSVQGLLGFHNAWKVNQAGGVGRSVHGEGKSASSDERTRQKREEEKKTRGGWFWCWRCGSQIKKSSTFAWVLGFGPTLSSAATHTQEMVRWDVRSASCTSR